MRGVLLGVDVGTKFVGFSSAQIESGLAAPLSIQAYSKGVALQYLRDFVNSNNPVCIILGLPLGDTGEETEMSAFVRRFAERVTKRVQVPVVLYDEYGSSEDAKQALESNRKGASPDERNDDVAAALILESFLRNCDLESSLRAGAPVLKTEVEISDK